MEVKSIKIGRADDNDIIVPDSNDHVSNHHAVLTLNEAGKYVFEDTSSNGTKINGTKIHKQSVTVNPGDEILLAGQFHLLWFEIEKHLPAPQQTAEIIPSQMTIEPFVGMLWDDRYKLEKRLGDGATAQVWEASDTKAGNIKVAVKIFTAFGNIGTRGLQIFESEFTSVHGLIQTNLLIPNNFDTCGKVPYLISKFCENGSAHSLIGKMENKDIENFMKDTAEGLNYLHKHGIVHQDIKPDNILIDDDGNYVLTDFGISNQADTKNMNGTPAYMAPERFGKNSVSTPESDIWSLGATVFEMITGDVPFGDNGGMIQAAGEKMPTLPKNFKSQKINDLLIRCLDENPQNRPTAEEIIMELEDNGNRKKLWIAAAAVAAVLAVVSFFVVNYFITKTVYYTDYVEKWGIPYGFHEISKSDATHRAYTYKFTIKKGKVRRVSLVNSKGKIVDHNDTESKKDRYVRYEYTGDGKYLNYIEVYDPHGKLLYILDYDVFSNNHTTASYKQKHGKEMFDIFLNANTTDLKFEDKNVIGDNFSKINRLSLDFDDNGFLVKKMFRSGNNPAHDAENIYGSEYEYDSKGRITEERFLGRNGQITGNKDGLAIKTFKYDENDNLCEYRYLNSERQAAKDPYGTIVLKCVFDKYGNRIGEQYFTLEGTPMYVTHNFHKSEYILDKNGFMTQCSYFDTEGKPMVNKYGYAIRKINYDENGFDCEESHYDENGNPTYLVDELAYHKVVVKSDSTGLPLQYSCYDIYDNLVTQDGTVCTFKCEYDENGNMISRSFYDENGQLVKVDGDECQEKREYDDQNNLIRVSYFDADGNPCTIATGEHAIAFERDSYGRLYKYSYFDMNGKLFFHDNGYAYYIQKYDDNGNLIKIEFYDADGNYTYDGEASKEMVYDPVTNFNTQIIWRDKNGSITSVYHYKYDNIGNLIQYYCLKQGKKLDGVVINYEYDSQNRETKRYATDLERNRINFVGETYCEIRNEQYDAFNNLVSRSYWDTKGSPTVFKPGVHKYVQEFDYRGKPIHEISYGIDGNPAKIDDVECKCAYNVRGNMTELCVLDGHSNPRLGSEGFYKQVMTYDNKNRELSTEFYDTENRPIVASGYGWHKRQYTYDNKGNVVKTEHFGTADKSVNEKLVWVKYIYKYDDKGNNVLTENYSAKQLEKTYEYTYDKYKNNIKEILKQGPNRKLFYTCDITYCDDHQTPKMRKYYFHQQGVTAYSYYNKVKREWGDLQAAQNNSSSASNAWVNDFNIKTPYQINNDYTIVACYSSGNTVYMTIKAVNVSKYNTAKHAGVKKDMTTLKTNLCKDKPSNCSLKILVLDKNNNELFSI